MKLSLEEKIEYILQYNRGDVIKTPDGAKSRSSFMNSLREWVKRYNEEGEAGLRRRKNKTCTEEEKKARRLEADNERLRAEIAVVKKSIALKMKARQQRNRR